MLPDYMRELAAFIPWLCVAILLMYKGAWVPGVLCLLSGATYPTLLVVGLRIEYLGLVPIIADAFLIAAIFAAGLGMAQYSNTGHNRARMDGNGMASAQVMAARQGLAFAVDRRGSEIKAGR
jgi:hypothetical protein